MEMEALEAIFMDEMEEDDGNHPDGWTSHAPSYCIAIRWVECWQSGAEAGRGHPRGGLDIAHMLLLHGSCGAGNDVCAHLPAPSTKPTPCTLSSTPSLAHPLCCTPLKAYGGSRACGR